MHLVCFAFDFLFFFFSFVLPWPLSLASCLLAFFLFALWLLGVLHTTWTWPPRQQQTEKGGGGTGACVGFVLSTLFLLFCGWWVVIIAVRV
jgi:hypothetical protein